MSGDKSYVKRLPSNPNLDGVVSNAQIQTEIRCLAERVAALEVRFDSVDELKKGTGEMAEMFGRLLAAAQNTTDHVSQLDVKFDTHRAEMDRRFTDYHRQFSDVCAIRHQEVNGRFVQLEHRGDTMQKRVEDMSEDSKVFYVKQLQEQLQQQRASDSESKKLKHDWRKWVAGSMFGIVMAVFSSYLTYYVTVATSRLTTTSSTTSSPANSR